jgi:hypothetical protein
MLDLTLSLENLLPAMPISSEITIKEVFGLGRKFTIHRFTDEYYVTVEFETPEMILDKNDVIYGESMSVQFKLTGERDAVKRVINFLKGFNFSEVVDITIKGEFEFKNIKVEQFEGEDEKTFRFFMPANTLPK